MPEWAELFLKVFLILTVISVIGGGLGWLWNKFTK